MEASEVRLYFFQVHPANNKCALKPWLNLMSLQSVDAKGSPILSRWWRGFFLVVVTVEYHPFSSILWVCKESPRWLPVAAAPIAESFCRTPATLQNSCATCLQRVCQGRDERRKRYWRVGEVNRMRVTKHHVDKWGGTSRFARTRRGGAGMFRVSISSTKAAESSWEYGRAIAIARPKTAFWEVTWSHPGDSTTYGHASVLLIDNDSGEGFSGISLLIR